MHDPLKFPSACRSLPLLLWKTLKSCKEHCRLEFADAVVVPNCRLFASATFVTATIDDGVGAMGEPLIIRNESSSLAGRERLGCLVAEGSKITKAPCAHSPPSLAVRVSSILDQRQGVLLRDSH